LVILRSAELQGLHVAHSQEQVFDSYMLNRRGLYDQGGKILEHLVMGCVISHQVWATFLRWWNKLHRMPQQDTNFIRTL
jgi:hypothetical protein